jgi:hypothetical protein
MDARLRAYRAFRYPASGWWLAVAVTGVLAALAYGIYALLRAHP